MLHCHDFTRAHSQPAGPQIENTGKEDEHRSIQKFCLIAHCSSLARDCLVASRRGPVFCSAAKQHRRAGSSTIAALHRRFRRQICRRAGSTCTQRSDQRAHGLRRYHADGHLARYRNEGNCIADVLPVNIAPVIGTPIAYVGFTAATGALSASEDIDGWTYLPTNTLTSPVSMY